MSSLVVEIIFFCYTVIAVAVGLIVPTQIKAFLITFIVGVLLCASLFYFKFYIDFGGLFHAFAFAGFSVILLKFKRRWRERKGVRAE
jgi:hypothetical protein